MIHSPTSTMIYYLLQCHVEPKLHYTFSCSDWEEARPYEWHGRRRLKQNYQDR